MARVLVVGAGVVGLTCAVRLQRDGHQVDVLARDLPTETASALAPGLWDPGQDRPADREATWAETSLRRLTQLAGQEPDGGVSLRWGTEVRRTADPAPWWADLVPGFEVMPDPPTPYAAGFSALVPVVQMPAYLRSLTRSLTGGGGTVTRMALPALPVHAEVVVNAAGLGSRLLAADSAVGHSGAPVVVMETPDVPRWARAPDDGVCVVPGAGGVVVVGTPGQDRWHRLAEPATVQRLVDRATGLVPPLRGAGVTRRAVGLVPTRSSVRLEAERRGEMTVVHCYGHGALGLTWSWGCAEEVAALVQRR